MDEIPVAPIGRVITCYPDKFGVPRQPGLVPSALGRLVFEPAYRRPEAVRGLEGFSHVWLVFLFDRVANDEVRLSVRPPRLGGNEKRGVFATRSPFRPNRIGLSVCRLEGVEVEGDDAPVLLLSGVDLVDGTPVLDVKPYLPYADRVEEASGAFADERPASLDVRIAEVAREHFEGLGANQRKVIVETLSWDARPAYHGEPGRRYYLRIEELDLAWEVTGKACVVLEIKPAG